MIFIGKNLSREELTSGFMKCMAVNLYTAGAPGVDPSHCYTAGGHIQGDNGFEEQDIRGLI